MEGHLEVKKKGPNQKFEPEKMGRKPSSFSGILQISFFVIFEGYHFPSFLHIFLAVQF